MADGSADMPLDLALVDAALNRLGYPSRPVTGEHELTVDLADDRQLEQGHQSARQMAVRSVAVASHEVGVRLLTFSTSYEFDADVDHLDDARLAAAELTQYLVLGHFEVDDDGSPHLRYSTLIEASAPPSDDVLVQLVSLLDYQQLHFGDYLETVCSGAMTIDAFADFVARGEAE